MDLGDTDRTLLLSLELPFLCYVLNVAPEALQARITDGTPLGAAQETALAGLVGFLRQMLASYQSVAEWDTGWSHILGAVNPEHDTTLANIVRLEAGGSIDVEPVADPVLAVLRELARDVFPLLLLPSSDTYPRPFHLSSVVSLFRHPKRPTFDDAVMADSSLTTLFPQRDDQNGPYGTVLRSTGHGGGLQLIMLAEMLIKNAWAEADLDHDRPALEDLLAALDRQLTIIRRAAAGEPTEVAVRIGLAGVLLPPETVIDVGWGRLRAAKAWDERPVGGLIDGELTHTDAAGQTTTMKYSGDVVLETTAPFKLRVQEIDTDSDWPADLRSYDEVERKLESIRLGLVLASDEPTAAPAALLSTWRLTVDPLNHGLALGWADPKHNHHFLPRQLTAEQAAAWGEAARTVQAERKPALDVAIRRTLRAIAEREDGADVLLDAVIAWENLVGSQQGEPTLRVSSALAWLFAPKDAAERRRLRTKFANLYHLRSGLVHGSKVLTSRKDYTDAQEAVTVAVDALRLLFGTRLDLLRDCRDSNERSIRLILGD